MIEEKEQQKAFRAVIMAIRAAEQLGLKLFAKEDYLVAYQVNGIGYKSSRLYLPKGEYKKPLPPSLENFLK